MKGLNNEEVELTILTYSPHWQQQKSQIIWFMSFLDATLDDNQQSWIV
jgi:hypothetical protein